jgi:ABC-type Zn uptake system ZnuABC Zn-binding protein ZnuA
MVQLDLCPTGIQHDMYCMLQVQTPPSLLLPQTCQTAVTNGCKDKWLQYTPFSWIHSAHQKVCMYAISVSVIVPVSACPHMHLTIEHIPVYT